MSVAASLELKAAALALPPSGRGSLLNLGAVAVTTLRATQGGVLAPLRGTLGTSPLARFHRALELGASLLGANRTEWATLSHHFQVAPATVPGELVSAFADFHQSYTEGIVAALLDVPHGASDAHREGHRFTRALFVSHGGLIRTLRRKAEAQLDEGLRDGAGSCLQLHRFAREAAYRIGAARAGRGADARGAAVRIDARAALTEMLAS
ncbi:MAG: hypothetical protein AAGE52_41095 [Myxococcota bacterium]